MDLFIDTCVLPRSKLEEAAVYRRELGPDTGFELLPMFDLEDFEDNLRRNLSLFASGPLVFHEPVWGVEHTAPPGTPAYEESMHHLRLTKKYADILRPAFMVCHLSNRPVPPGEEEQLLRTALQNLDRLRGMFLDVELLVENTGIRGDGTLLLDQQAFTDLCVSRGLSVLIDVGHAAANGWDLPALLAALRGRIRGYHLHNNDGRRDLHDRLRNGVLDFPSLVPLLLQAAPDVPCVIEYTRPAYHGAPLLEDAAFLRALAGRAGQCS